MRRVLEVFTIAMLWGFGTVHAQEVADYVTTQRGDTLVVKDFVDMDYIANSLADLVEIDSLAPEGRVYELKSGGLYFHTRSISVTNNRELIIAGEDNTSIASSSADEENYPPRIIGTEIGDENRNGSFISYYSNTTIKNIIAGAHSTNETEGWTYFDAQASGITLTLDNVYMEHTYWVFVQSNGWAGNSLKISNSYFVNMNGNGCRRNGGVFDNVATPSKELIVENTTHIMGAGRLYNLRWFPFKKVVFNHNTFVNISNSALATLGYQVDWVVTNNLFVNSNVQAYYPGLDYDPGNSIKETDQDLLPMGIINVDSLNGKNNFVNNLLMPDDFPGTDSTEWHLHRKILVDKNAVFWSPELFNIVDEVAGRHEVYLDTLDDGRGAWPLMSQMITMNSRTQAMFDNDDYWPYLNEGIWLDDGDPGFTEDGGLLDINKALGDFKEYTIRSLPADNYDIMESFRTPENPAIEADFAWSDWPIPVDLSYSNTTYLNGGISGFPVGDLNWFPDVKASWDAQRDFEYDLIEAAKNEGTPVSGYNDITKLAFKDSMRFLVGDTVNVPVNIELPRDSVMYSFQFDFAYDSSIIEFLSANPDSGLSGDLELSITHPDGFTASISGTSSEGITGAGVLFNLKTRLKREGTSNLIWTDLAINDGIWQIKTNNGQISASQLVCGDVTGDQTVSALDASYILRHVVKLEPQYPFSEKDFEAADVTGNGKVTAFDASKVIQHKVGLLDELLCFQAQTKDIKHGTIANWQVVGTQAEQESIRVKVAGNNEPVFALNMEITLREGQSTTSVSNVPKGWQVLSNRIGQKVYLAMYGINPFEETEFDIAVSNSEESGTLDGIRGQISVNEKAYAVLPALELDNRPALFDLKQNYPNPFNPSTNISYSLPEATFVSLVVYNTLGQQVAVLVNQEQRAGDYVATWHATDLASGVYIYQLQTGNQVFTKRMMLIK